jgi:serine/threonine-protein kinase RIO1
VLVQDVRTMFQVCRLVHADLSEYNILYFEGRLAIIDVSQVRTRARTYMHWRVGGVRR